MVQSMEELKDVYQHFLLYYGHDIPKMKNSLKKKKKKKKLKPVEPINVEEGEEGEGGEKTQEMAAEEEEEEEEEHQEVLKQATRKSGYNICAQAGLGNITFLYNTNSFYRAILFAASNIATGFMLVTATGPAPYNNYCSPFNKLCLPAYIFTLYINT